MENFHWFKQHKCVLLGVASVCIQALWLGGGESQRALQFLLLPSCGHLDRGSAAATRVSLSVVKARLPPVSEQRVDQKSRLQLHKTVLLLPRDWEAFGASSLL